MQIIVDRDELAVALSLSSTNLTKTGKVSEAETNYVDDVYESVMFEVLGESSIFVNATNGMVWTRARLHGEARGLGRVLIKSSQLGSIVSALDPGPVIFALSKDSSRITLTSGSYVAEFGVRNAIEYPAMPDPAGATHSVEGSVLKELIKASEFCAYEAVDRPYLQGVNIEVVGGSTWAVAANGPAIAVTSFHTGEEAQVLKILTPTHLARHAARMAVLGPIDFGLTKSNMAVFRTEDITVVGKIGHQKFPDWRSMKTLPSELDSAAWGEIETKTLAKACKRILSMAGRDKTPSLLVEFSQGKLHISTSASGRNAIESLKPIAGDAMRNGKRLINGHIFGRIISAITTDRVMVRVFDESSLPVGVTALRGKDDKFSTSYYIMPRER